MAKHQRKPGETVAQEKARLKRQNAGRAPTTRAGKRQDTVAERASKRRNVGASTRRGR